MLQRTPPQGIGSRRDPTEQEWHSPVTGMESERQDEVVKYRLPGDSVQPHERLVLLVSLGQPSHCSYPLVSHN